MSNRPDWFHERHHLIAIHHLALLVGQDHPVGIAVQRHPQVRAVRDHGFLHVAGHGRAAVAVDVKAVGRNGDRNHLRPEFVKHLGRHAVGRAVRAIDHDLEPIQAQGTREGVLDEFDVAA